MSAEAKVIGKQTARVLANSRKRLEQIQKALGQQRDALRDIHSEIEGVLRDADDAADALAEAIEVLSRLQ